MTILNKKIGQFKKALEIKNEILGIHFLEKLPKEFKHRHKDTACTALARCFFKKKVVAFGPKNTQLCPGADYFLKFKKISEKETIDTYIRKEQVFENQKICKIFLKELPKIPDNLKNKFILTKPLDSKERPAVVILLVSPAQAGRIIGLLNYKKYKKIEVNPNQPTCISFFAPIATGNLHINFLDYYDRYYQGVVNGRKIWNDNQMILSLKFCDFEKILDNLTKSPQGSFKPKLSPQKVDKILV